MGTIIPRPTLEQRLLKARMQEVLLASVYDFWQQRLQVRLDELLAENSRVQHKSVLCLRLRGTCYLHSTIGGGTKNDLYPDITLHPSLKPVAHTWCDDNAALQEEQRLVSYSLASVLGCSNHLEDYKLLLPSPVHSLLDGFLFELNELYDQATTPRITPVVLASQQATHAKYLDLMGQRFAMSLIV